MPMPNDANARKYYRVARQRLAEAELILAKVGLPAAATYIAGYSVECSLKALLLSLTSPGRRAAMITALKNEFGHDLQRLRMGIVKRGVSMPHDVAGALLFVSSWSPAMRYDPGPGDGVEAGKFLRSARRIVAWVDTRV